MTLPEHLASNPGPRKSEYWVQSLPAGCVLIRPWAPQDVALERHLLSRLTAQARRYWSLVSAQFAGDTQTSGFVALAHVRGHLRQVGQSRLWGGPQASVCHCAVIVDEPWQRSGLGHQLMQHLIATARQRGYSTVCSVDRSSHYGLHRLFKRLGFSSRYPQGDFSEIIHELKL